MRLQKSSKTSLRCCIKKTMLSFPFVFLFNFSSLFMGWLGGVVSLIVGKLNGCKFIHAE